MKAIACGWSLLAMAMMTTRVGAVGLRSTALVALDGLPLAEEAGTVLASAVGSADRPNGSVSGTARATASFGSLGVFAQFSHSAFESTVVTEVGVAQALASFSDRVGIENGAPTLLGFVFQLEGQAFGPELEAYGAFRFDGDLLVQTQSTIQVQTPYLELRPGEPVDVLFELIGYAARGNSDFGTSRAEFDRTLRLLGVVTTDLEGNPVNVDLVSESGTLYPRLASVPDTGATVGLFGLAVGVLVVSARLTGRWSTGSGKARGPHGRVAAGSARTRMLR